MEDWFYFHNLLVNFVSRDLHLLLVIFLIYSDQKEIYGVRNGTKDDFYKMLELVSHITT